MTSSRRAARDGLPPSAGRRTHARAAGASPASRDEGRASALQGQQICVAQIGAAHGTTGEVRLWPFTAEPLAVARYGVLATREGRTIEIEGLRPAKGFLIARIKGVTDRNAAEVLNNAELFVPRDRLPPPSADEYYHADLIGLAVQDPGGNSVGTIIAVHDFGAGDLLEIAPVAGGATMLLPFTATAVPEVDIAAGFVVVDPPAEIEAEPVDPQQGGD